MLIMLFTTKVFAWEDKTTHPQLSEHATTGVFDPDFLTLLITQQNESLTALDWIKKGATLEDQSNAIGFPTRSLNHFHAPTKDLYPTDSAGLNDLVRGNIRGQASKLTS